MSEELKIVTVSIVALVVLFKLVMFWTGDTYKIKTITDPEQKIREVKSILITKRISAKSEADVERAKMLISALSNLSDEISEFMIDCETKLYKSKNYIQSNESQQEPKEKLAGKGEQINDIQLEPVQLEMNT